MIVIANKYQKLNWIKDGFRKPWVSRKYRRPGDTNITHDLRCDICGKWYNYSSKDIESIKAQKRWNYKTNRPYHCGKSLCWDYHEREMIHKMKMIERMLRGLPEDSKVL